MDKLKEERNWTERKDSQLVKNLLIKHRHDYAPKRVQTLIQLRQTATRKRSSQPPHQMRQKNARRRGRP